MVKCSKFQLRKRSGKASSRILGIQEYKCNYSRSRNNCKLFTLVVYISCYTNVTCPKITEYILRCFGVDHKAFITRSSVGNEWNGNFPEISFRRKFWVYLARLA